MKTEITHAEQVRRWFERPAVPVPPSEEELLALATGQFDVIDAEAVAAELAADPASGRCYEEIRGFLESRSLAAVGAVSPVAGRSGVIELALAWMKARNKSLGGLIRKVDDRLEASLTEIWTGMSVGVTQTLSMRGFAPSGAGQGGAARVRLTDPSGREVLIAAGVGGYLLELDLQDPRINGFLTVQRVLLHGGTETEFSRETPMCKGRAVLTDCPPGLIHVHLDTRFELYLLLEDLPGSEGATKS